MRSEFELIDFLTGSAPSMPPKDVGVGDDCAVVAIGEVRVVIASDAMVDGVHFRPEFSSASEIGEKLVEVNVSDFAAMGARPVAGTIVLQRATSVSDQWLTDFYEGIYRACERHAVMLVGGDTVASETLAFSMTLIGQAPERPLLRSGANEGDDIWVSGKLGLAGSALRELLRGNREIAEEARRAFSAPTARLALGTLLSTRGLATAAIDVSDGLLQDLGHLLRASQCSAELDADSLPVPAWELTEELAQFVSSGEDYELLFTAPEFAREQLEAIDIVELSRVGRVNKKGEGAITIRIGGNSVISSRELLQVAGLDDGFSHF